MPAMTAISMAEAKSRLSEVVSRAAAGERILVQRRTRPAAVLISPQELERLDRASKAALRLAAALGQDEERLERIEAGLEHPAMAAFGLWQDEPEFDDLTERLRAERDRQAQRPEIEL